MTSTQIDAPVVQTPPEAGQPPAIARQAILDRDRNVFGYELFNRSLAAGRHNSASDAELLFNVLTHPENAALIDKKLLFLNCTHDSLLAGHLDLVQPDRVVLEVPPVDHDDPGDIALRAHEMAAVVARGFRLAFSHTVLGAPYASWAPMASYIKLDLAAIRPEMLERIVRFAQAHSKARLVAEKVETEEQFTRTRELGVKLFQGYWFSKPVLIRGQAIRPGQASIIQLINLVRKQASAAEIEEVLKRDPSLSFNLLRLINSAGFGLSCEVTSFRHAVMIMGLQKLYRWAALLLTTSRQGDTPPSIGVTAIVRGRLMELLAAEMLPAEECDNAFVVGVFSLLDAMLGVPMEKALATISLPDAVTEVLLHRKGVFAPFLDLTLACENADEEAFARAVDALQLTSHQVNWAHLQALAWAETMTAA